MFGISLDLVNPGSHNGTIIHEEEIAGHTAEPDDPVFGIRVIGPAKCRFETRGKSFGNVIRESQIPWEQEDFRDAIDGPLDGSVG